MHQKERIPLPKKPAKEKVPATPTPEEKKKNCLDELYEYGKSKGTITYKEIMDRLV